MAYATPADLLAAATDTEALAQVAAPTDGARVSGALLRATVTGAARTDYSAAELAAADLALARLGAALERGSQLADSYLRQRHRLPLSADLVAGSPLGAVVIDLALADVYAERGSEELRARATARLGWLRDVAVGRAALGPADVSPAPTGRVVVAQGVSSIPWDQY